MNSIGNDELYEDGQLVDLAMEVPVGYQEFLKSHDNMSSPPECILLSFSHQFVEQRNKIVCHREKVEQPGLSALNPSLQEGLDPKTVEQLRLSAMIPSQYEGLELPHHLPKSPVEKNFEDTDQDEIGLAIIPLENVEDIQPGELKGEGIITVITESSTPGHADVTVERTNGGHGFIPYFVGNVSPLTATKLLPSRAPVNNLQQAIIETEHVQNNPTPQSGDQGKVAPAKSMVDQASSRPAPEQEPTVPTTRKISSSEATTITNYDVLKAKLKVRMMRWRRYKK